MGLMRTEEYNESDIEGGRPAIVEGIGRSKYVEMSVTFSVVAVVVLR